MSQQITFPDRDASYREIAAELYVACERLGARSDLLGVLGSWGDTLPDEDVLALLRAYNAEISP